MCLMALALPFLMTGCTASYAKHSVALEMATAPVVDGAAAAYRGANTIHSMRTDVDAITQFDAVSPPAPVYNPRTVAPLLSEKEIQARLKVLAAFQEYTKTLVAITNSTDSPELQAAAKSAGAGITNVTNTLTPSVETAFGLASQPVPEAVTTTVSTPNGLSSSTYVGTTAVNPISETTGKMISVGLDALGQFLTQRRLKQDLPKIVSDMDPLVKQICDTLASDITNLRLIEEIDYNYAINQQTLFLRVNGTKVDPGVRRAMIMKLPEIAREQKLSDAQLTQLSGALLTLELTHHAFAVDLQGNNPESIQQKLAELEAAGQDLGKFYSSL
jgi:hypothetical protein